MDIYSVLQSAGEIILSPMTNILVMWSLIPVYINWFLNEVFFESDRHNFQSAFTNGFAALWIGMDWLRVITVDFTEITLLFDFKVIMSIIMVTYGLLIMVEAARGRSIAKYIGRVREISLLIIFLTPVIYSLMDLTVDMVFGGLIIYILFSVVAFIASKLIPPIAGELRDIH
jgi:hypothetical protein